MKLIPNLAPIDHKAIHELGIPGLLLMEEAGRNVALRVSRMIDDMDLRMPVVTIVCGSGNNGGDGYVCARHLAMWGNCWPVVIHAVPQGELSGDALTNFNMLQHHPVEVIPAWETAQAQEAIEDADIIVDSLFGSGLSRPVEGIYCDLINAVNQSNAIVLAVDIPSGVDGATGQIKGIAVQASHTVTFATSKPGLHLYPGKSNAGMVQVVDIGIPESLIEADPSPVFLLMAEMIRDWLPRRQPSAHKFVFGNVLVVAGSREMPGAAVLTAEAALNAGSGVVTLAAPASALQNVQMMPEIIRLPLPESEDGTLCRESFEALKSRWKDYSTVAFGPGITAYPQTIEFCHQFTGFLKNEFDGGVVIDADGLNCLKQFSDTMPLDSRFILTPHIGECARLTGLDKDDIERDLLAACEKTARRYQSVVVLKSGSTVIFDSYCQYWVNPTGNPGMATPGSGDVQAGIITALLGQGLPSNVAACVGTYLHGLAGDFAAKNVTQYCLTATDLIRYLPEAIQHVNKA